MSLLDRRLPVWPWFLLALLAAGVAGALLAFVRPAYPTRDALVPISGTIASLRVIDDLSGSAAGAAMPSMTSVVLTLEGVPGAFRYPSSHPDYPRVRDSTGGAVDLLVEKARLGSGAPVVIWQIHERNPINLTAPPTDVSYDAIVARLRLIERSVDRAALALLAAALGLAGLGAGIRRRNRRFPAPPV